MECKFLLGPLILWILFIKFETEVIEFTDKIFLFIQIKNFIKNILTKINKFV